MNATRAWPTAGAPGLPSEGGRRFWIFYGWLIADEAGTPSPPARRIAAAGPGLLIAPARTLDPPMRNLSAPVMELLRQGDVAVLAYVDGGFGQRHPQGIQADIDEAMSLGASGVLLDRIQHRWDLATAAHHIALTAEVRAAGGMIALNTGVAETDEALMSVADLLMVEHSWRGFAERSPWRRRYDPLRFMGVSSNEPGAKALLGYHVDHNTARHDTREAWSAGIGWHCATDRYIELPPWLETTAD